MGTHKTKTTWAQQEQQNTMSKLILIAGIAMSALVGNASALMGAQQDHCCVTMFRPRPVAASARRRRSRWSTKKFRAVTCARPGRAWRDGYVYGYITYDDGHVVPVAVNLFVYRYSGSGGTGTLRDGAMFSNSRDGRIRMLKNQIRDAQQQLRVFDVIATTTYEDLQQSEES